MTPQYSANHSMSENNANIFSEFKSLNEKQINYPQLITQVGILLMGGLITLGLFVFMAQLVKSDAVFVDNIAPTPVINYVQRPEEPIKPIKKIRSQPEKIPPLVQRDSIATDSTSGTDSFKDIAPDMTAPTQEKFVPGFNNGDAMPVVQVSPQYPMVAARDGKEGYVIVMFDISASGVVTNAQVVEAEPKRTFNRAALQAINNWKYKPKTIDGVSVVQRNQQVRLDFSIDK
ncbi:energy transducer TonB [Shewanella sp. TC10]|uniref:energy transducer TonB n=1 Tax=Shewanella sp. TC10 TaxID=1419739 RepID=UPI001892CFD3|nr:energy transducer TonB [Shewanella sp. TC10]